MDKPEIEVKFRIDPTQIEFRKAYPLPHMQPQGFLPQTEEAAALWQFLVMANQALEKVEAQVTYEGDSDQVVDVMQLANSARKIYGLDNLEGMFQDRLVETAKREAKRSGLHWNPRLDAWFASGGKSYRIQDRDADKVGH